MILVILKSILILIGCVLGGGILGFIIPFVIAQFDPSQNPAWSFIPLYTVPIGFVLGLVLGLYFVFR